MSIYNNKNELHPLAFLSITEAVYSPVEEKERDLKRAQDQAQIAANKAKNAEFEAHRQRVLSDFERDEEARKKETFISDLDDYVEDPGGYYHPSVKDREFSTEPEEGWEPGEAELLADLETNEDLPKYEPFSKAADDLKDFKARLGSKVISMDEIKRLEKLLSFNYNINKPKKVRNRKSSWDSPKPTLFDLLAALKRMISYLNEVPSPTSRVASRLTDSIKSLQRTIAILLPKD